MFVQVYRFLCSSVRAYLPSYDTVTLYFLRDLVSAKRRIIKCEDVKVIQIPQFEHLAIPDMLEFARQHEGGAAMMALPEMKKEINKLPRAYIANIIYSVVGEPFLRWMNERVEARN